MQLSIFSYIHMHNTKSNRSVIQLHKQGRKKMSSSSKIYMKDKENKWAEKTACETRIYPAENAVSDKTRVIREK